MKVSFPLDQGPEPSWSLREGDSTSLDSLSVKLIRPCGTYRLHGAGIKPAPFIVTLSIVAPLDNGGKVTAEPLSHGSPNQPGRAGWGRPGVGQPSLAGMRLSSLLPKAQGEQISAACL
jgi:hypothetical protein